jgi:hypothetical protein
MKRLAVLAITIVVGLLSAGTALAGSNTNSTWNTKTFTIGPGQTKTFNVPFADPGVYGQSAYTGKVQMSLPKHGTKPALKNVKIKKKGATHSGKDYSATIQNKNAHGTASVTVKITATTTFPGFY